MKNLLKVLFLFFLLQGCETPYHAVYNINVVVPKDPTEEELNDLRIIYEVLYNTNIELSVQDSLILNVNYKAASYEYRVPLGSKVHYSETLFNKAVERLDGIDLVKYTLIKKID